jgi:hypothetical protein
VKAKYFDAGRPQADPELLAIPLAMVAADCRKHGAIPTQQRTISNSLHMQPSTRQQALARSLLLRAHASTAVSRAHQFSNSILSLMCFTFSAKDSLA